MIKNFIIDLKKNFNYICALAILFSITGWVVENVGRCISYGIFDCRFHLTPTIPVYGLISFASFVIGDPDYFLYALKPNLEYSKKNKILSNVLFYIVIFSIVTIGEFIVGNLWEIVSGVKLWDYSAFPFHVTQYCCLYSSIGYSTGAFILIKYEYFPHLNYLKEKYKNKNSSFFSWIYLVLLVDMFIMIIRTLINSNPPIYWSVSFMDNKKLFLETAIPTLTIFIGILLFIFSLPHLNKNKENN